MLQQRRVTIVVITKVTTIIFYGGVDMDAQRCLEILREVKDVAFATVDEKGLPQVRMIDVMIVENEKMYFFT